MMGKGGVGRLNRGQRINLKNFVDFFRLLKKIRKTSNKKLEVFSGTISHFIINSSKRINYRRCEKSFLNWIQKIIIRKSKIVQSIINKRHKWLTPPFYFPILDKEARKGEWEGEKEREKRREKKSSEGKK